ncbi:MULTISPECIES: lysophospholipid acyltransferase family protein [Desulfosediminicola]|uniref:lysophospholipid acyltransferase family protein n=1 Tax=Desulfosediminicola TaxID=2886823 RepID=UPI0010AD647B|nr:lysophospholipid acyltransferase family protein [Desulfosediminicola ganghwensis]
MKQELLKDYRYVSAGTPPSLVGRTFPSLIFYIRFIRIISQCASMAKRGEFGDQQWLEKSWQVVKVLEDVGVRVRVTGMEHVEADGGPCVFIGNHMSFLETVILPAIILPKPVTFVVKQSLLEYPIFKHVLASRDPIAVTRTNPRQDLKAVLDEGVKRLQQGTSVVVFPQSTRSHVFDPAKMSSIGVKLARKANVPVVPIALKTDALQNGKMLKDFGKVEPSLSIEFAFGAQLTIEDRGNGVQEEVNSFIEKKLDQWGKELLSV